MKCFRKLCLTISFVALGGCATMPTRNEIQQANYGTQISKSEFENAVRNGSGFFDPYSAVIGCTDPKKGWEQDVLEPMKFGYIAQCSVNAKNRMGGYVGAETKMYILSNNVLYPIRLYNRNWGFINNQEAMFDGRKSETASNAVIPTVVTPEIGVKLNVAAMDGNESAVLDLLNKGANVNTRGYKNITPLMFAALNGHVNVVNILIEKGADINSKDSDGKTAAMHATEKGYSNIVKILDK